MEIITNFQKKILKGLGKSEIGNQKDRKIAGMIQKVTIKELKEFFLKKAKELISEFDSEK